MHLICQNHWSYKHNLCEDLLCTHWLCAGTQWNPKWQAKVRCTSSTFLMASWQTTRRICERSSKCELWLSCLVAVCTCNQDVDMPCCYLCVYMCVSSRRGMKLIKWMTSAHKDYSWNHAHALWASFQHLVHKFYIPPSTTKFIYLQTTWWLTEEEIPSVNTSLYLSMSISLSLRPCICSQ